jgi:hypothetical protein
LAEVAPAGSQYPSSLCLELVNSFKNDLDAKKKPKSPTNWPPPLELTLDTGGGRGLFVHASRKGQEILVILRENMARESIPNTLQRSIKYLVWLFLKISRCITLFYLPPNQDQRGMQIMYPTSSGVPFSGQKPTQPPELDTRWARVKRCQRSCPGHLLEAKRLISGKNMRKAPAQRIVPLSIAHSACGTSQNAHSNIPLIGFLPL